MKSGIYKVEVIDKRTALLKSMDEESEQYTFPISEFTHEVTTEDIVKIWFEGTHWRAKYLEEETKSAKSHLKDFKNRIFEDD